VRRLARHARRYLVELAAVFGILSAKLAGAHVCQDEVYALLLCLPFVTPIRAWLSRSAKTWRNRHQHPVCTHRNGHKHGLHFPLCASCGMPEPDHDVGCKKKMQHWSGYHHYAIFSNLIKAYTGCCSGREDIGSDQQDPAENPLAWIQDLEDCPNCGHYGEHGC
jgi:hypothetical protein